MKDNIKLYIEYFISLLYLEIVFRIFGIGSFSFKNLYILLYLVLDYYIRKVE